jgi:GTP cyclohydrolase II
LKFLEVVKVRLLTNNPKKVQALENLGIEVAEVLPVHTGENPHNKKYLSVKAEKMGHWR